MLNKQQQQALEKCVEAYMQKKRVFGLFGGGGVGKTYTSQHIISEIAKQSGLGHKLKVMLLTPTNSALKSLKNAFGEDAANKNYIFKTIYSALKKQPDINDFGKIKFEGNATGDDFSDIHVIYIDEASMVSKPLVQEIMDLAEEKNIFIIASGDKYQHYPVGEKTSELIEISKHNSYELTQIMRQTGDVLAAPIQLCRDAVITQERSFDPRWTFDETITETIDNKTIGYYILSENELRQMHRAYHKAYEQNDFSMVKIIGHRNKTIDELNLKLRDCLWGEDAPEYVEGELLLIKAPVQTDVLNPLTERYIKVTILHTGAECLVEKAEKAVMTFLGELDPKTNKYLEYEFTVWELSVREIGANYNVNYNVPIKVLSNDSVEAYDKLLEKYKIKAKKKVKEAIKKKQTTKGAWVNYYKLLNAFNYAKYGYACTSVYVQGKSYKNVFVLGYDIASLPDTDSVNRAFYVALSRAVEKIIIC